MLQKKLWPYRRCSFCGGGGGKARATMMLATSPSNRTMSMKLLVIAGVTYIISIQFQKTVTLLTSTSPYNHHLEYLPLEARRLGYVPRNVFVAYSPDNMLQESVKPLLNHPSLYTTKFAEDSMPPDGPLVQPDWYEPNAYEWVDGYDMDVCIPMNDWQAKSYPTCNTFHEIDLGKLRVINTGGSRIAFEMKVQDGRNERKYVYKTIKYSKEITMKKIEEQRKDSMVMERTTASKFIPDIWGYCSLGVMMDFMPEGNMHDYIKGVRLAGGTTLLPIDQLRISIHIATSVADLHTIDGTKQPSMFHNDICCHQYLFQNGYFKLNDFNYARPIYIHKRTKEQCTRIGFGMAMWKGRSLEEHLAALEHPSLNPAKPDKIDVWMMGNVIYYILTDLYTFEKPKNLNAVASGRELAAGRRSPYPERIENSEDLSHTAIKKALDMCWTQDWTKRPSAREISDYLIKRLRAITGEADPDLRVVLPKRDPDQKGTDSDYAFNNA